MVKEIDSQALQTRFDENKPLHLIDIRTEAELRGGVLPQASHLPMHLIPLKMNDFPRDKEIILYCRSGARSYHACRFLMQQGFDNVINLRGGILDWARQGLKIEKELTY